MALSGMQIYKLLPRTNCKECGYPTCLAFASMVVSETIRVRAEGRDIRRGIYRDFPTRYRDRWGNRVNAEFVPLSVSRNGESPRARTSQLKVCPILFR